MALNIDTLKTRSLTAAIFVIVMLSGLLINYWSFFILFTIIHFGCWVEYQKLMGLIDTDYQKITPFHQYIVMLGGFGLMLFCVNDSWTFFNISLSNIGLFLIVLFAVIFPLKEIVLSKKNNVKIVGFSFVGLAYISLSWALMISIRNNGIVTPIIIIASIWINDTMAYIVGSLIGKTPLTKISPKKTWEGTIGGAILAIVVVGTISYFFIDKSTVINNMAIATIAAIIGTLGDLLESKLKRKANVKDSGSFMPGHGGFLDRFDSLLLATPFVWLFLQLIK